MSAVDTGEDLLAEALSHLRVETRRAGLEGERTALSIAMGAIAVPVRIKRWASFPDSAIERNAELRTRPPEDAVRVVVADRISTNARSRLTELGWGWLDLRGHLRMRAPGLIIDADIPPLRDSPERTDGLSGKAGMEVACAILAAPRADHTIRALARATSRSVSTVSQIVKALRSEGVLPAQGFQPDPELFWRVAGNWDTGTTFLSRIPSRQDPDALLQLGWDDEAKAGWALTGDRVALALGAPLAQRADSLHSYYIPSPGAARRATSILGRASDRNSAAASITVAPIRAVCEGRIDLGLDWPCAHGLYVALGLAADAGRGREVLDSWRPDFRVW